MEQNEIIKEQIIETIENQIKNNDPPETILTLQRLVKLGYSEPDSKLLLGQCLAVELFIIFKHGKPLLIFTFFGNISCNSFS